MVLLSDHSRRSPRVSAVAALPHEGSICVYIPGGLEQHALAPTHHRALTCHCSHKILIEAYASGVAKNSARTIIF